MSERFLLLGVLVALLLGMSAPLAYAEDPVPPAPKEGEGEEKQADRLAFEDLDTLFGDRKDVLIFVGVSRWGALVIGIVLLVLMYLRYDKIRGGVLPAPTRTPPPELFEPGMAILLALAGAMVLPFLISTFVVQAVGHENFTTMSQIIVMGAASLPVAAIVVLRRYRLGVDTAPRWPKPMSLGLGAFCVATVFVLPLTLVTVLVMKQLGYATPVQQLVQETVQSPSDALPIVIAVYGVLIAPFVEECIFRGLVYPALKSWWGGTPRASVLSAVVVSLVFAAVHASATAFIGLFCLAMVLTWVYEKTNSMAAIVVAHATNNFLSLVPLLMVRYA